MGWIACVRCQKFRCEFVAKNSNASSWHELLHWLHQFSLFRTEFHAVTRQSKMHPNTTKHTNSWVSRPMGWIGCIHCEKLWCDFAAQNSSLIALVQPILHWVPGYNETLRNAPTHYKMVQNMSLVPMGWIEWVLFEKFRCDFIAQTCALIAPVQPVLHRVSCSNKTLTNAPKHYENTPKHEFRVQWGGSHAFVA